MFAFDLAFELSLGAGCAALDQRSRPPRAFIDGLVASSLVYVPFCTFGLVMWPGWQAMYSVNLDAGGFALALAALVQSVALVMSYLAGYVFGRRLMRSGGARRLLQVGLVFWPLIAIVLFGVLWRRASTAVSHREFHARTAFELAWGAPDAVLGGPVSAFLLVSALINATAIVVVVLRARAS